MKIRSIVDDPIDRERTLHVSEMRTWETERKYWQCDLFSRFLVALACHEPVLQGFVRHYKASAVHISKQQRSRPSPRIEPWADVGEARTLPIVQCGPFFHFTVEAVAISFDSSICSRLNGLKLPDWTNVSEAGTNQLIRRTHFVLAFALNESGALFVMFAWGEILLKMSNRRYMQDYPLQNLVGEIVWF